MPVEKSAGIIVFRRENKEKGKIYYLLLHYQAGHWDFPKGHIEEGESEIETALRELKEETGISEVKIIPGFRETIKYFFKRNSKAVLKFVFFYLGQTRKKRVKLSFEHIGYKWLPLEKALEQLTFKTAKNLLKKAHQFLVSREYGKIQR
jgi:8-oxo-dGTP pyrophosphatase MutT (NUDIX family)